MSHDPNHLGQELIHALKQSNHAKALELINKGADVNKKDTGYGMTPLGWAIENGLKNVVYKLIEVGADIHYINGRGDAPLTIASRKKNNFDIITKLLELGADFNKYDIEDSMFYEYDRELLSWAAQNGRADIVLKKIWY